jgi:hypothetical protein
MTDLKNEVRELAIDEMTIDELDMVSGGGIIKNLIAWYNTTQKLIDVVNTMPLGTTLK